MTEPEFEWYDAWILTALLFARDEKEPVSLKDLIAVADGINKAMVTRSELEVGIGRLVAAGYVRVVSEGFELTPKALALPPLTGLGMDIVSEAIGAKEWSPDLEMPSSTSEVYVTRDAYAKAEKQYRREFWKKMKE